jgi:ATP-dependent Clp protease ATP-binding subunit ClpA
MNALRVIADGLIQGAEALPRKSVAARHLREAAASLLDADCALEAESPTAPTAMRELMEKREEL